METSLAPDVKSAPQPKRRTPLGKKIVLGAGVFLMIGALALQLVGFRNVQLGDTEREMQAIGLKEQVPLHATGWSGKDEPLGPTEFIETAVERNLNYDDVVNRIYASGGRIFGVYSAYWTPERMPVQKVASHTPDRCWTENGWRCQEYRKLRGLQINGREILPAYWRTFEPPGGGKLTHVMYWHLVGGEYQDRGEGFNLRQNPVDWWKDTVRYALQGSAEQYFIRITSDRPFEEIWDEAGVQEILAAVAEFGLWAGGGAAGGRG